ncbi:hypothetical protein PPERSA_09560 [Pseudocohnilembus persalinus]|uniref:Uncharacterized protein n=1 Tax=Pseudocohnilembus persalinus TaxID=266149 RepID=A0A0V0QFJ4_PSEPJ|nr:hypothetical protein PPERSA_09560 [Pseudocohnilembus persalinus]|eukprot:KRX00954.1 hypothetical protein PPERSA_09560 [Pseudocohnilembus persalinus]
MNKKKRKTKRYLKTKYGRPPKRQKNLDQNQNQINKENNDNLQKQQEQKNDIINNLNKNYNNKNQNICSNNLQQQAYQYEVQIRNQQNYQNQIEIIQNEYKDLLNSQQSQNKLQFTQIGPFQQEENQNDRNQNNIIIQKNDKNFNDKEDIVYDKNNNKEIIDRASIKIIPNYNDYNNLNNNFKHKQTIKLGENQNQQIKFEQKGGSSIYNKEQSKLKQNQNYIESDLEQNIQQNQKQSNYQQVQSEQQQQLHCNDHYYNSFYNLFIANDSYYKQNLLNQIDGHEQQEVAYENLQRNPITLQDKQKSIYSNQLQQQQREEYDGMENFQNKEIYSTVLSK